jgi:hypothetical protein
MIMTALIQLFGAWHHERGPGGTVAKAYAGALPDTSGTELLNLEVHLMTGMGQYKQQKMW